MTGNDAYKLRNRLGLTRQELATALGISIGAVDRNERQRQSKVSSMYRAALANYAKTKGVT